MKKAAAPLQCFGVRTRVILPGDDLVEILTKSLPENGVSLEDGDVVVISSKVCALLEGNLLSPADVRATAESSAVAREVGLPEGFVECVLQDAQCVVGLLPHVVATVTRGVMVANAGIDLSNAPPLPSGQCRFIRFPRDPDASALRYLTALREKFGKSVGVVLTDSVVHALRRGTTGVAIAVAGFRASVSEVGQKDIFGHTMRITWRAVADDICAASELLMGETANQCPVVVVRGSGAEIIESQDPKELVTTSSAIIPTNECLYMGSSLVPNPDTQSHLRQLLGNRYKPLL